MPLDIDCGQILNTSICVFIITVTNYLLVMVRLISNKHDEKLDSFLTPVLKIFFHTRSCIDMVFVYVHYLCVGRYFSVLCTMY